MIEQPAVATANGRRILRPWLSTAERTADESTAVVRQRVAPHAKALPLAEFVKATRLGAVFEALNGFWQSGHLVQRNARREKPQAAN